MPPKHRVRMEAQRPRCPCLQRAGRGATGEQASEEDTGAGVANAPCFNRAADCKDHSTMKLSRLAAMLGALAFSTAASAQTAGPGPAQPPAPARPTAPRRPRPQPLAPGHIVITARD